MYSHTIPVHIQKHYELWKKVIELEGPQGLKRIKEFHDEILQGIWYGHRSSRLSLQWRVIYRVEQDEYTVYVIDINPHDYR